MSRMSRVLNDPNARHNNHQLTLLKRLQTRKQSSDTVNFDLESKPEQSAKQSIETTPDKIRAQDSTKKNFLIYNFLKVIN